MNNQKCDRTSREAFTLVELLVVVATIGLIALTIIPALAGTRPNTQSARCLSNLSRLTQIWQMFSTDNADRLMPNGVAASGYPNRWADGDMDWTTFPDNTNATLMVDPQQSAIGGYTKDTSLFKCSADTYQSAANPGPRVRSVSLSAALGGNPSLPLGVVDGRIYIRIFRISELNTPGPANIYAFLDEHPDSIDDAIFQFNAGLASANRRLRNVPASYHNGAANLSFADGHVQTKRWQDSRTGVPVLFIKQGNILVPDSVDYEWLNDRVPYRLQ